MVSVLQGEDGMLAKMTAMENEMAKTKSELEDAKREIR